MLDPLVPRAGRAGGAARADEAAERADDRTLRLKVTKVRSSKVQVTSSFI